MTAQIIKNGMSSAGVVSTKSEIERCMSDVDYELGEATDKLSSLHVKLGSIMTPASPVAGVDSCELNPDSPLGQALDVHKHRLRQINASLTDLLNRVAL